MTLYAPSRLDTLPLFHLNRVTTEEERTYETPAGIARSVTTVLDRTGDSTKLAEWRESIGEARAKQIRAMAAYRGEQTHQAIENYLLTGTEPAFSFLTTPYWNSIKEFVYRIDAPLIMEAPVWYNDETPPEGDPLVATLSEDENKPKFLYAGTLDCLAYLNASDTQPTLIDWKTADKPLKPWKVYNYSLQLAAYWKAANYVYGSHGLHVTRAMITVAMPDEPAQFHILEEEELEQLYLHFLGRLQHFIYSR